ncbi:MAG TPA: ATP-binding protein [Pyrinomonadaceae bacterium]
MPDFIFFYRSLPRVIIVLLFVTAFARAEQLSVKTYTSADGLIYEGIYRLYQDSRGFIWFATPIGIRRIEFRINPENEFLIIEISDDGRGFDTAEAENPDSLGGNGLINMRRRAENLGGTFAIDSAPGKGARAVIKIPIFKKLFSV